MCIIRFTFIKRIGAGVKRLYHVFSTIAFWSFFRIRDFYRFWKEWARSIGVGIRTFLLLFLLTGTGLAVYLGLNHYFNQKMQRVLIPVRGTPQWEIRYPYLIYVNQTRILEVYRLSPRQDGTPRPTDTPPLSAPEPFQTDETNATVTLALRPPFLRLFGDKGTIQYQAETIKVIVHPENSPMEVHLQNKGLTDQVWHSVTLQIKADNESLNKHFYVEGPLGALLRKIAQVLLPVICSTGVIGLIFTSLRHYQKMRERRALLEFENLRTSLRIQPRFPDNFEQQLERLRPFETLIPAKEYQCLKELSEIYQGWRHLENPGQLIEKERQFVQSCSLEWIEALLLLWEKYWPKKAQAPSIAWDEYRLILRQLPRFQFSDEGVQRVKRLLQHARAPQVAPPTRWPPKADERCVEQRVHARIFEKASSLFPEGEALDARLPRTQAWLFGQNYALFWVHPLLVRWRSEPPEAQSSSPRVYLVVGERGSGRTALALAVGRYLHGEERLGFYVDNPRHLQDIQHALAHRLLTFLCVRAPDAWQIERGLREALLYLWLSIWPKAVVRARFERSLEEWSRGRSIEEAAVSPSFSVERMARVELKTWLRMLDVFEEPDSLSPEAWWQLAAEIVPALSQQIRHVHDSHVRGWVALWIAVDLNAALAPNTLASWQQAIAPLARQIPTTWFVFQPHEPEHIAEETVLYQLVWSRDDLLAMLRHRKSQLAYPSQYWPKEGQELREILEKVSTPRALGRRWLAYEQAKKSTKPR